MSKTTTPGTLLCMYERAQSLVPGSWWPNWLDGNANTWNCGAYLESSAPNPAMLEGPKPQFDAVFATIVTFACENWRSETS